MLRCGYEIVLVTAREDAYPFIEYITQDYLLNPERALRDLKTLKQIGKGTA